MERSIQLHTPKHKHTHKSLHIMVKIYWLWRAFLLRVQNCLCFLNKQTSRGQSFALASSHSGASCCLVNIQCLNCGDFWALLLIQNQSSQQLEMLSLTLCVKIIPDLSADSLTDVCSHVTYVSFCPGLIKAFHCGQKSDGLKTALGMLFKNTNHAKSDLVLWILRFLLVSGISD